MEYRIEKYDTVTSTNDLLKEKARAGAPAGTVVVAARQTAGRGRMGRSFLSEDGGLYMSVLLRPAGAAADALRITAHAAVAVALAMEKHTGKPAAIKWVNDIYQGGKKVCGILAEGQASAAGMDFVVLGIGLNLKAPEGGFPEALRDIAGALFAEESFDKDAVIRDILENLSYENAYAEYAKRDMLLGKTVTVYRGGEVVCTAKASGITEDFGLRIVTACGEEVLHTGEVTVRIQ